MLGKYNFIISTIPFDHERFFSIPIVYYNHYVWVNDDNPLSNRDVLEIEDLNGQPIFTIGEAYKLHHTLKQLCLEKGFEPNFIISTNDRYLLLPYTLQNYGISIAMKREDIFIRSLPIKSIPINGYGVCFGICYTKDHVLTAAENILIQALKKKAASRKKNL